MFGHPAWQQTGATIWFFEPLNVRVVAPTPYCMLAA
jgi:hypothetical protein